jgi:hypothetical protein
MKKFLYFAATALLLASCTEDFKDWAEPQSNPQGEVITFGNGSVTPMGTIDFAEETGERVKVCDITAPSTSDTAYHAEYVLYLNDQAFVLAEDGTIVSQELKDYVISLYGKAPEPRVLNAQVEWVMSNGTTATTIKSEPFELTVILEPIAKPDLWYLVGSCIGDGSWGNDPANVGTALIPMYTEAEDFTVLTYVGYFPAGQGFKLIHNPGNWDEQWGMKDGELVKNDGGSSDIVVPADGYYLITYDMNAETLTIDPYVDFVGVYSMMGMPGGYQDWNPGGTLMNPMSTVVENHDWMAVMTFEENTELKFAADGGWAVNWGGPTFPVGVGVQNGANIPVEAGTYRIVFNDILGRYYFIAQ